jgi:DNA polymerase III delta prime subunit
MNKIQQQFSQLPFSHHSYGIMSSHININDVKKMFPKENFSYVVHKKYDTLKIDDAREIKSLHIEKTEKPSVFILEFSLINILAQNTLLKVLEEPSSQTYFILVFPDASKLLPTLRSRLFILEGDIRIDIDIENPFVSPKEFEFMSLQKRFEIIKENNDKKKDIFLSKSDILQFLDSYEVYESKKDKKNTLLLEIIYTARTSLHANGASHKMILDLMALHI